MVRIPHGKKPPETPYHDPTEPQRVNHQFVPYLCKQPKLVYDSII